ncbi:hypothetical protein FJ661_07850 [Pseudarthrobacter phenanthrenivorans]|uniref:hypothetical protein n=1 Tax=Pseudarthrobacter phenanthrenivorans TaxID=361575 RepID=UPI001127449C|nr:hypothetical protein [Pseudarthrobacter phenanthrenivorans]TPV51404.1 hypothetical protein FJ661_07850 [Pseudarthrobacter phenanthrenivorans]
MSTEDGDASGSLEELPPAVRAQLLATEHWGLLASRSTTQSEVLTRISMFLTFTSASVVSVALVGQATRFSDAFVMVAVIVLCIDVVMGLLTQVRVFNVGQEDLMYVTAMNRLRAAYVDLDPGVAPYLMAAHHDDEAGASRTYFFFGNRNALSHVAGSSMVFMTAANAALIAILAGLVLTLLGAGTAAAVISGAVVGLVFVAATVLMGYRAYTEVWLGFTPISPTPPAGD